MSSIVLQSHLSLDPPKPKPKPKRLTYHKCPPFDPIFITSPFQLSLSLLCGPFWVLTFKEFLRKRIHNIDTTFCIFLSNLLSLFLFLLVLCFFFGLISKFWSCNCDIEKEDEKGFNESSSSFSLYMFLFIKNLLF